MSSIKTNNANFSDKIKEMQSKYSTNNTLNKTNQLSSKKEANLMVQMNLYDNEKMNNTLLELNDVYESQVKRLTNLKEEDPSKCIENCSIFLENNENIVESQLENIISLEKNIKNVVEECEKIEDEEEKLNEILNEPKYIELAEKIKLMRSTVDNLNFFLVKKKISNYKN
mgnify:CR=1 FL=1